MTIPPIAREIYRDIGIGVLLIKAAVVDGDVFVEKVSKFVGLKEYITRQIGDRRTKMSLISTIKTAATEVAPLIELEPLIVKFVQDATAAAPELKADGEAILAKVESIFHAATPAVPATPPATPPPAAA